MGATMLQQNIEFMSYFGLIGQLYVGFEYFYKTLFDICDAIEILLTQFFKFKIISIKNVRYILRRE